MEQWNAKYEGVLIDGCIPRSDRDRCDVLYDYLITMRSFVMTDEMDLLDPEHISNIGQYDVLEDQIRTAINGLLSDVLVCIDGETNPGDVVVTRARED